MNIKNGKTMKYDDITKALLLINALVMAALVDFAILHLFVLAVIIFMAYTTGVQDGTRQGFRHGAREAIKRGINDYEAEYKKLVKKNLPQFVMEMLREIAVEKIEEQDGNVKNDEKLFEILERIKTKTESNG